MKIWVAMRVVCPLLMGCCAIPLNGQDISNIPQTAISAANSFVLARDGQAYFYNYDAGLIARPFLRDVYKPFGFSFDAQYFLYLKAKGKFPTFELHSRDLITGKDRQIADTAVHHAAWSPAGPVLAYVWLDKTGRLHVSTYDMASGVDTEIASGQLRADFLEWSADGSQLMYMEMSGLTQRSFEDGQFTYSLRRYSLRTKAEDKIAAADWAQFSGNELVVLSNRASLPYRTVPNPKGESIRRFAMSGRQIYVELLESGRPTVKRWNPRTTAFEAGHRGQIYLSNARGVVIRSFSGSGPEFSYLPNDQPLPQPQDQLPLSSTTFKIPFSGLASVVQGGSLYVDGSCDGALCFVTAHAGALGYAIDWQQMPDLQQGNGHVLATADGTVAVARNNVTCNTATPGCMVGWDDYNASCPDSNLGAGNFIAVAHLDGTYSLYAHLKSGSVQVLPGQTVSQGTYLADQGHSGVAGSFNTYLSCGDHLHFSRQVGPGIWDQTVPTDFVETPCLMGCATAFTSSNVELVAAPEVAAVTPSSWTAAATVPITLTGQNFIYGSTVAVNTANITVSGVKILSATRLIATLTISSGTPVGPYEVTVSSANGISDAVIFSVIPAAAGGMLTGSVTTPASSQQLTLQGGSDWAHWGVSNVLSYNHKSGTSATISNFAPVGSAPPSRLTGSPVAYTWTDGTPAASASGTTTGISVSGQNSGFRITAPADTTSRTLKVYVGVSSAQGQMQVQLSDGSAADYLDSSLSSGGGLVAAVYTITYQAASAGQTLVVTYTQASAGGSVNLQAATLDGGAAAPDFTISAPPSIEVLAGTVDNHAVNITALSGFTGSTTLSATGLPPGVTADFAPPTLSGAGSSNMAITVPAGTTPGTYPIAILATSGSLSRIANLNLVVVDFSLVTVPATRTVIAGGAVTYSLIASAPLTSPGTVSYSASGLPAGVTAAFNPAAAAFNAQALMTVTASAGVAPGSYPFTVTATIGTTSHAAPLTLVVTAAMSGGSLSGSLATPSGTAQLTTAGTFDWAHWGLTAATDFNHKAAVTQQIGNMTQVGNAYLYRYANNSVGFTWTDGTPTASVSNSTTGVFSRGQGNGFTFSVPADTTVRVLKVYVGVYQTQGRMVARLSDGSAADYADTSMIHTAGVTALGVYTFTYSAASAGQTLTVTYVQDTPTLGNVTLQAATLSGAPDFSVSAVPAARTIVAGSNATYSINTTALAGFAGNIGLTISGLPAGVSAGFSPATVSGSGSSTLTLTTTGAAAPGTYPLTVTGASGALSHTTGVTLIITTPASGGVLNGSMATPTGTVQLTTEGSVDWSHWGLNSATDFNHKAVAQQISNITMVGPTAPTRYANNPIGYTWTDGMPTGSATASTTGIFVSGLSKGFQITAPADTAARTLKVYVGAWRTQGNFTAHLSDGSAADFVSTALSNSSGVTTLGVYTLTYAAASAGQTLTVTYTQNTATTGNIAIQAATLSGGVITPDFSVSATPGSQSVAAGNSAPYTVSVTALNGFVGSVGFAASGLPAGVSAAFSPGAVTGSGSSTMTLSSTGATTPGSYPVTITATSGSLVHTANVTLIITAPPDFTVGASPASRTVMAGNNTTFTLTVTALNGFAASTGFTVSGLPAGVTPGFSPATVTGSGTSTLTLSTTVATAPGTYPLVVTATSGSLIHTANVSLTVTAPLLGTLSGSMAAPVGPVQLTTEGSADWSHWGLNVATDFNHKTGITQQISNYAVVGTGTPGRYANNAVGFTWTDGTPSATATNSTTGLFISGQNGFRITVPADQAARTLKVYVGAWRTQGQMVAHLSDGSALDYVDSSLSNSSGATTLGVYSLTYSAGSPGQTLTVTFTNMTTNGNVTLQAATLSGGAPIPDFTVGATPASQSVVAGSNAGYTVSTTAVNGFTGSVGFTMSGLPSGVTTDFSPTTVTGSGSSTLTLTTAGSTTPGTYPLVVTAASGSLSHTANITLIVTGPPDFTVGATPASQSVVAGGNAGYTVSTTALNGFGGSVGFTMSGLPSGVTADFSPVAVTGSGSSTLTLTTAGSTTPGTYPLVMTAASGSLSHTANITLIVTGPPDFTVGATPASQSVAAGSNAGYTVSTTALNGFSGSIGFAVSGLPAGVTAGFSPANVTGSGSSTLTLTTTGAAAAGAYLVTITATSGNLVHTVPVNLTITVTPEFSISTTPASQSVAAGNNAGYTVTITALNGFADNVGFTVSGLPAGATSGFSPAVVTGGGATTLTLSTTAATAAGSYPLVITATSGALSHTSNITLTVTPAPDFTIGTTPASQSVAAGNNAGYTVTITGQNGFAGSVGFAVSGLPAGVTAGFSPGTVTGSGTSALTLTTTGAVAAGSYPLVITATSGALSHTSNITLTITPPPDFTIGTTPASQSVAAGNNAGYTITITGQNGFAGSVGFAVSGLPAGVTAGFSPGTVTGSGTTTLTLTTTLAAVPGTYPVTVTATSGSLGHTSNITLGVTPPPDFTIGTTPASRSVVVGSSAGYTVTITSQNGFAGSVGFAVSGLPAGVTAGFSPGSVNGSGTSTLTLSTTGAAAAGSYPLTITATSGALSHTSNITLIVTIPVGGALSGSMGTPSNPVQLTTEGSTDWAHWGLTVATDFNHKTGITQQISNYTVAGSGMPARYANNAVGFTWTDGTPTATATNSTTGVFIVGQNNGFRLTAPADTTVRALKVYVGAYRTRGQLVAHLSDGSAADFVDTSLVNSSGATTLGVYTLTYAAGAAGQTLTVTYTNTTTAGNVTLQAATLSGGALTPDFTVGATPSSQSTGAGGNAMYTVNTSALNGFSGSIGFSVSTLPSGVTAGFSPATVTGTGSSTLTLTVSSGTAAGTYPVTITATSGALSHTANITLVITPPPDFSVSATPASRTIAAGSGTTYTTTITAQNGFAGSTDLTLSGLPAGVTGVFSPGMVTGAGSSTLTMSSTIAAAPGVYPLTVTATSGSLVHTANISLTVTAAPGSGTLTGSMAAPVGPVPLTVEGTLDWTHWGLNTVADFDHKSGGVEQIGNYTLLGGAAGRYANNAVGFTWTDGAPNPSATNSTTGLYVSGLNLGFRLTVPAGTVSRTLKVYVGAWRAQGKMVAHLSDGSAVDFVDGSLTNSSGVTTLGVYTLTYRAASAGQTLTVTFTNQSSSTGNVTLQAATLSQ